MNDMDAGTRHRTRAMRRLAWLVTFLLSVWVVPVLAQPQGDGRDPRRQMGIQARPPENIAPPKQHRISSQRAASLVKQRYASSRVLGVSLMSGKGSPIYRVKTLSQQGVVKSVFVDGRSGKVFE